MTEIDEATLVIGLPKHGKTTIAREEIELHLATYPTGIVLAHDLNEQFADFCRYYESTEQWREAYRKANGGPFPRAAAFLCEASKVGELVLELGRKFNRAKDVKLPIKYLKDEESNSDTSEPTYQGPQDRTIWSNRRHLGVAPYSNAQVATDINDKFYRAATKVFMFNQSEESARYLEKKLSLPKGALQAIVNAPPRRYVLWRQGTGLDPRCLEAA